MAGNGTVLQALWQTDRRWEGIERPYSAGDVAQVIAGGQSAVTALNGSTEEAQFKIETAEVSAASAEPRQARAVPCEGVIRKHRRRH